MAYLSLITFLDGLLYGPDLLMVLLNLCNKASWIWTEKVTLIVHLTTIYIYTEKLSWSVFHGSVPFRVTSWFSINFKVVNFLLPRFSLWYRHG